MLDKLRKFKIDHLRPEQRIRYEEIKWLLDDINNRQTGRSYLMVLAFLETAAKNPGKWVRCFDHTNLRQANVLLTNKVKEVFGSLNAKGYALQVDPGNYIRIIKLEETK